MGLGAWRIPSRVNRYSGEVRGMRETEWHAVQFDVKVGSEAGGPASVRTNTEPHVTSSGRCRARDFGGE